MSDALVLTFPNEQRFFPLVRLVLSGLAAQLDLPYERIDDLQLAVEGALAGDSGHGDEVTMRIEPRKDALAVWIHPIGSRSTQPGQGAGLGFDRIAAELVDSVETVELDGKSWLHLEKRIPASTSG